MARSFDDLFSKVTDVKPILTEDLIAGKTVFRKGAGIVKELYLSGTIGRG